MRFGKKEVTPVSVNHPVVQKKINKSLDISIKEGSSSSITSGLGVSYFTPYALALKASSFQIGMLHAFINLFPSLIQLWSAKLVEKSSRKKIVIFYVLLQALIFIPIIATGFLFLYGFPHVAWILILLITIYYTIGAIPQPAWFSWMGSLVPEEARGKYFARRNRVTGFFGLVSMIIGAVALDYSKTAGFLILGFGILFVISMFARLIGVALFTRQYEPHLKVHKKDYFTLRQFLKRAKETPFGRFTYFTTVMRIAVNVGSPFFAIYLLKNLGLSYVWFMAITVSAAVFQLIFYPVFGKLSDRFGNIRLLKISCFSIAIIPFMYLISKNPYYLLTIPQIVAGFGWAGFNLAVNNYIYDSVRQEKRCYGVTYFNLLGGVGLFIGAGIGSLLVLFNIPFMDSILFIIMISGILRLVVAFFGSDYLREVRPVKKFRYQFIFKEILPVSGIVREIQHLNHKTSKVTHFK